jgi:hypothetical protein
MVSMVTKLNPLCCNIDEYKFCIQLRDLNVLQFITVEAKTLNIMTSNTGTPLVTIFQRQSPFYGFYTPLPQCSNKFGSGLQMSRFFIQVIKFISDKAY